MTYTEQCAPLIRHIHCAMEKEANNKLREMDLTVSQIYLLQALNHAPGGTHALTLKELERRLQKKDFVTCTQSVDDKRIKIVALTTAGESICQEAESHMVCVFDHMSEGLSEDEKKILLTLLRRVQQNFIPNRDSKMNLENI